MSRSRSVAIALLLGAAWIVSACATHHEILEAVGPAPPSPPPAPHGFLRVYTPTEVYDDKDVLYYPHRDFTILSLDGKPMKHIRNADHHWDETPALTPLPVGSYKIRSRMHRGGIVTIPVVVELGRTTNVYLDGTFERPETPEDAYVQLPTGEIIGWRVRGSTAP